jgi:predicted phosphoribosyltransferase
MNSRFQNRREAGRLLAERLGEYQGLRNLIVLGLPRGGVPVADEVATKLGAPLDVLVVRKLGLPAQPELAMGAIAPGGVCVLNKEIIESLGIPRDVLAAVVSHERTELERREREYRDSLPPVDVQDRTVILVDDGIATGATVSAAITALREMGAERIVVATPVASPEAFAELSDKAEAVFAVIVPENFYGVGQWYEDFSQTTDAEVRSILAYARKSIPSYATLFRTSS